MTINNSPPAHTPGPWYADEDDTIVRLPDDTTFDCIRSYAGERSSVADAQDYANAVLIAAAPDMRAALIALLEHEGERHANGIGLEVDTPNLERAKHAAKAAIAKAGG